MEINIGQKMASLGINEKDFRVLIISERGGDTTRYRAFHKKEQLDLYGIRCDVINTIDKASVYSYDIFISHRIPYNNRVKCLLNEIRRLNKISIFDVDDLIFEPEYMSYLKSTFSKSAERQNFYIANVENFLKTLNECNYCFASTEFLADRVRKYKKEVFIIRNALSKDLIRLSEQALLNKKKKEDDKIILGYFSGTNTHDNDFKQIEKALVYILKKYKNVELQIVGRVEVNKAFKVFKDRVEQ